jgi:Domain of unknown function (DUF4440)
VLRTRLVSRLHPSVLLALLVAGLANPTHAAGRAPQGLGRVGGRESAPRRAPAPETTAANATGDAAEILGLEQKIEAAVVRGDVAFAETVLSSDFHFRHGDGWTRGEKTGGIEDDRAAFMKRIADKEYLVHDLDNPKIEMHGNVAITWGRYVSLFVPLSEAERRLDVAVSAHGAWRHLRADA